MVAILSPAKKIRAGRAAGKPGKPQFLQEAIQVVEALRPYAAWELERILMTNPEIALDACLQYRTFDPEAAGREALFAYNGLVYQQMNPTDFSEGELAFANAHLRILSAVYGILLPLDGILPCRLEMQCKLPVGSEKNLYAFWGDKPYRTLFSKRQTVINLASEEYAKIVRQHLLSSDDFVDIVFLARYKGKLRTLPAWAKMARGQMARYMVKNWIDTPEELKGFDWNGYAYVPELSYHNKMVFVKS